MQWIQPEKRMPEEGQRCWVAYHPWGNPSNKPQVQAATWKSGLWLLDGNPTTEGGTCYPPIAWMPNANEPQPTFPLVARNSQEDLQRFQSLSDEVLSKAYEVLMGQDWKRHWSPASKAREMRSIIDGGTQPCVPFESWIRVVNYLQQQ